MFNLEKYNFNKIFAAAIRISDNPHYALNLCLVLAEIRPVMYIEMADFLTKSGKIKASYSKLINWIDDNTILHINPQEYGCLVSLRPIIIKKNSSGKWLGKLLGYDCPGQLDGNYFIRINASNPKFKDVDVIVQRCNEVSEQLEQSIQAKAALIRNFFDLSGLGFEVDVEIDKIFTPDALKKLLNTCSFPPGALDAFANHFWNFGFYQSEKYAERLMLKAQRPTKAVCNLWLKFMKYIEDNEYNISDFPTREAFARHNKIYEKQVAILESEAYAKIRNQH